MSLFSFLWGNFIWYRVLRWFFTLINHMYHHHFIVCLHHFIQFLFLKIIITWFFSVIYWNIIIFMKIIFIIIICIIIVTTDIAIWIIFLVIIYVKIFSLYIIRLFQTKVNQIQFVFSWLVIILSVNRCNVLKISFFYIHIAVIFLFLFRCSMNPIWTCSETILWMSSTLKRRIIIFFWIWQCYAK